MTPRLSCRYPDLTASSAYSYGCRCPDCRAHTAAYWAAHSRARRAALAAIGPVHGPRRPAPARVPAVVRVLARVVVDPGGCWLWPGAVGAKGYGAVNDGGRAVGVHRVMVEAVQGPIPPGLHVDHLCAVRVCCNPDHLEVVTPAENDRRARARAAVTP